MERTPVWGEQVLACGETGLVWEAHDSGRSWDFRLTEDGLLTFFELFILGEVRAPESWLRKVGKDWPPQWTSLLEQLRVLAYEPRSLRRDLVACNILLLADACDGPPNLAQYAAAHSLLPSGARADLTAVRASLDTALGLEVALRNLEESIPEWFEFSAETRHRSLEDDVLDLTAGVVVLLAQPRDARGDAVVTEHIRRYEPLVQRHWALIDRLIADVEEWLDSDVVDEHAGWLHDWGDVCRRLTLGQHVQEQYLQGSHEFRLDRCIQVAGSQMGQLYDLTENGIPFGMPRHHWWWFGTRP